MTARDRFTRQLRCPQCGLEGEAALSQADGWEFQRDDSTRVDHCPDGFRAVYQPKPSNLVDFYCVKDDVLIAR